MPFFHQNHGLTLLEKCKFFDFLNFLFLCPRKGFFFRRILLRIFSLPILPKKKKFEKWPFLDQNNGLTPLKKCQFFDFLNSLFFTLKRPFFVLEYREEYFPCLYCLTKKVGKMAILGPKPWVNPFGKMSISRLFKILVFIA